ncbi:TetR/AcrR family transcriptional regulator [Demequina pelophila]|uniref:TetR/AcrR family transcriptional regulator n=1 Tax=Demequina pelophila TaxID=1638984 RepID=UPI0007848273|nr:TetR/AcrR family transcriptional regulator [Demequina pelophila]
MPRPTSDKRERLTTAAFELTRESGVAGWTLAHAAERAEVAAGSVYYHFKSKDALVRAVLDALGARLDTRLAQCAAADGPKARLIAFVDSYDADLEEALRHGPVLGSLGPDLARPSAGLAEEVAALYERVLRWLQDQFEALGYSEGAARGRALHLFTGLEGAAKLSHLLGAAEALDLEVAHLRRWVERAQPA